MVGFLLMLISEYARSNREAHGARGGRRGRVRRCGLPAGLRLDPAHRPCGQGSGKKELNGVKSPGGGHRVRLGAWFLKRNPRLPGAKSSFRCSESGTGSRRKDNSVHTRYSEGTGGDHSTGTPARAAHQT